MPKALNFLSSQSSSPYHESVEGLNNMGNMEYRRASFLDAISFYDKAIALCPQNAACHYNKAASLIGLGRLTESMEECLQAIKCDPSCSRAHHRLGILYARFEQEVLTAEKAVDLDTTRKSLKWLRKARGAADARKDRKALFEDGKYLEACTKYGHGLQYVRTNSVLLCNRASCKSKPWTMGKGH
ncbi:inactive TPR repeat-containing thioredoxin TTL3-like [Prunus persica]|uniref:inactive TPR repeat-containing thioredoxin TTL3-like n=1 Tax=Prunus persica TaxID=3760 RepID=UPI0009AB8577|nr:inactive TPR repeat-containing thioredoxin TTL3-like [Prunus persica]